MCQNKQAETQAEALADIVEERLATKTDIASLQRDIEELELRLTYKLTIRMGSMLTAAVGILAALMLFLDK